MTDKTQVVTFTPEERAILDGTATVKVEETDGETTDAGNGANGNAGETEPPSKADGGNEEAVDKPDAEEEEGDEDEEVLDVVNSDGEKTPRRMVHYGALKKERVAKEKARQEAESLRQQVAYLTGLSQNAPKPQQQAPQQAEELSLTPPDKTKEPEKYLAWLETAAAKALQFEQRTNQQSEQSSRFQQINDAVYAHEQAFIKGDPDSGTDAHPDFLEAVSFLRDKQTRELKLAGYEQHEINQIIVARAQDISLRALKANDSPAKRVYALAKENGYKRPAPKETEAEKIARQAKSQEKAGKTISALPGGEAKGGLTAETLANTSPDEFLKLWNKGEAKALMGWKD
jgi:hypothetical protein